MGEGGKRQGTRRNRASVRVELVHMRLHDLGAEVDLRKVGTMLGLPAHHAPLVANSAAPPYSTFPQPKEVTFPWEQAPGLGATVEVRLHQVGAVTVRFRWHVEAETLAAIRALAAPPPGVDLSVDAAAADIVARVRQDLAPALHTPYVTQVAPERYLAYCIETQPGDAERMLAEERGWIAALVANEPRETHLPARMEASFRHLLQQDDGQAVIPGWDHAVIMARHGGYEDVLDVMELANLELLEFRTYDAYLDERLDQAVAAVDRLWARGGWLRSARTALQDISRVRAEITRLNDNLHDTGKIFGDWHTAQLHQRLQARFHLGSWERAIKAKMDALEDMFHLAQEEANHRRSLILEGLVILLFVLDLLILLRQGS
jgi:hypothetical protein